LPSEGRDTVLPLLDQYAQADSVSAALPPAAAALLREQSRRAARHGGPRRTQPLVVPVCYVFDGRACFSAIDAKPKRVGPRALRRVRNIADNPAGVPGGRPLRRGLVAALLGHRKRRRRYPQRRARGGRWPSISCARSIRSTARMGLDRDRAIVIPHLARAHDVLELGGG